MEAAERLEAHSKCGQRASCCGAPSNVEFSVTRNGWWRQGWRKGRQHHHRPGAIIKLSYNVPFRLQAAAGAADDAAPAWRSWVLQSY
jgi:hypothetical protein